MVDTSIHAGSYTFDPFARHQFYHDINQSLVHTAILQLDASLPKGQPACVAELASGTGAVTELILDELENIGRSGTVIGIEPSFEAIDIARERLRGRGVRFEQGDADHLADIVTGADEIFFCNAIHLVPNKRDVLQKIARALRKDGLFACNSSFFAGAYPPGSERFYHLWIRRALGWIRQQHPELRRTGHHEKATAMSWLTAEEYADIFDQCGLHIVEIRNEEALMPLRSWQDIGRYWLFIEGALPGVPIPIGADALEYAAAEAFAELQITEVPRIWLQMVAQNLPENEG
ncbi:MAG: class I SAM-dependent methyltransferase [Ktedonobacterales bacterium]